MKKSERLQPILDLASSAEHKATLQLGKHQQHLEQQQLKLEELMRYRQEYLQGFHQAGKNGLSAAQLSDYHLFITRLDAAIEQQRNIIKQGEKSRDLSQQAWLESRRKKQAMETVVERHVHREEMRQNRKEQNEQDEWVSARSARRETNADQ